MGEVREKGRCRRGSEGEVGHGCGQYGATAMLCTAAHLLPRRLGRHGDLMVLAPPPTGSNAGVARWGGTRGGYRWVCHALGPSEWAERG